MKGMNDSGTSMCAVKSLVLASKALEDAQSMSIEVKGDAVNLSAVDCDIFEPAFSSVLMAGDCNSAGDLTHRWFLGVCNAARGGGTGMMYVRI